MPIYEYHCKACSQTFELLVGSATLAQCPHCASVQLQKLMSSFAHGRPALTSTFVPPGTPGHPGN